MITPEKHRSSAGKLASSWKETASKFEEQAISLHKWILASCLTINSGGVVLVLSNEHLANRPKFFASLWFAIGVVTAVVYAISHTRILSYSARTIRDLAGEFESYSEGLSDAPPPKETALKPLSKVRSKSKISDSIQYLSLSCFIVGALIVGWEFA